MDGSGRDIAVPRHVSFRRACISFRGMMIYGITRSQGNNGGNGIKWIMRKEIHRDSLCVAFPIIAEEGEEGAEEKNGRKAFFIIYRHSDR